MHEAVDGVSCRIIPDLLKNRMDNARYGWLIRTGNLSGHDDIPSGGQRFAGHTGERVVREAFVQYTVCDDIAQFIRMPLRHGFGGIALVHLLTSPAGKKA